MATKKKSSAKKSTGTKKKSTTKKKTTKRTAPKPYIGPAVALEEGVRVEGAKRGEVLPTAESGVLNKSDGLTKESSPKPSGPKTQVTQHPFPPETQVGIYPAVEVDVERRTNREPFGKPAKTVKVTKDGSLEVSGLDPGSYVGCANVGTKRDPFYQYVGFQVK